MPVARRGCQPVFQPTSASYNIARATVMYKSNASTQQAAPLLQYVATPASCLLQATSSMHWQQFIAELKHQCIAAWTEFAVPMPVFMPSHARTITSCCHQSQHRSPVSSAAKALSNVRIKAQTSTACTHVLGSTNANTTTTLHATQRPTTASNK